MIFFISEGRLGNQLFQYAFLNHIAKANERIICFNMDIFKKNIATDNKKFIFLPKTKGIYKISYLFNAIFSFLSVLRLVGFVEEGSALKPPNKRLQISTGLFPIIFVKTGFFQSEDFFDKQDVDFYLKDNHLTKAKMLLAELEKDNVVFIHVRRGDYLQEVYNGKQDISLPKAYYQNAINFFVDKLHNPFFVFLSDDGEYVQQEFAHIENKYISNNSMLVDLAIMSLCDYGVLSNSSFSWWGAYLSENKKNMIFPKYWFGWKSRYESHLSVQPQWATILDPNS